MGLRFAARVIATREQPDEAVEEVTGDEGNIAEYLLGEVLSAQPPEIRQLLLSTSVPDTLRPGLTEEMGGRSAGRTLALLTKGNAFIEPVPEHAGFYRYHPFFRDMLRAELAFESPELMDELQRRAAEWFSREGFVVEAVSHFASIDAWTDAAAELVDEPGCRRAASRQYVEPPGQGRGRSPGRPGHARRVRRTCGAGPARGGGRALQRAAGPGRADRGTGGGSPGQRGLADDRRAEGRPRARRRGRAGDPAAGRASGGGH